MFFDQTSLSIYDLQIDYLNLDSSVRSTERSNLSQSRRSHCGGSHQTEKYFKQQIIDKGHNKKPLN